MKIDLNKINLELAKRSMRKNDLARNMGRHPQTLTHLFGKIRRGEGFEPYLVGDVARALGCKPEDIVAPEKTLRDLR